VFELMGVCGRFGCDMVEGSAIFLLVEMCVVIWFLVMKLLWKVSMRSCECFAV